MQSVALSAMWEKLGEYPDWPKLDPLRDRLSKPTLWKPTDYPRKTS